VANTLGSGSATPQQGQIRVVKTGYSPDKLYIDGADSKGHYEKINGVRISPDMEALMMQAISDNPGYGGNVSAFVRDAITHRLHYVSQSQGSTINQQVLQQSIFRAQMHEAISFQHQLAADLTQFKDVVEVCADSKDWTRLSRHIDQLQHQLETIEYAPGHRDMIEQAIDDAMRAMKRAR